MRSHIVALDIETTGLMPVENRIVAVGVATTSGTRVLLGDERTLLKDVEGYVATLPRGFLLITWNGEEFDLPFLKARYDALGLPTTLTLVKRGTLGKYGKPQYWAQWGQTPHIDIAPRFESIAQQIGVKWSLKPVARAVLGVHPIEVDNRGEAIARMAPDTLAKYVQSDAEITLGLSQYVTEISAETPG